jgi:hypothetical protein
MRTRTSRKFTILDGMILVAAVAAGFALRRAAIDAFEKYGRISHVENKIESVTRRAIEAEFPFLLTLTPAVLVMRLRRPRPRWLRLVRQPGMAAACAALVPIATSLVKLGQLARALEDALRPKDTTEDVFVCGYISMPLLGDILGAFGSGVGLWVVGAWLILALSGRRPERSWIDWLGRAVGMGWVSIVVMEALRFVMSWKIMS